MKQYSVEIKKLIKETSDFFCHLRYELINIDHAFITAKAATKNMSKWDFYIAQQNVDKIVTKLINMKSDSGAEPKKSFNFKDPIDYLDFLYYRYKDLKSMWNYVYKCYYNLPIKAPKQDRIPERALGKLLQAQESLNEYEKFTTTGAKFLPAPYHAHVNQQMKNFKAVCESLIARFQKQGIQTKKTKTWHANEIRIGRAYAELGGLAQGLSLTTYRGQPISQETYERNYNDAMQRMFEVQTNLNDLVVNKRLTKQSQTLLGIKDINDIPQSQKHVKHYPESGLLRKGMETFVIGFNVYRKQKYTKDEIASQLSLKLPTPN